MMVKMVFLRISIALVYLFAFSKFIRYTHRYVIWLCYTLFTLLTDFAISDFVFHLFLISTNTTENTVSTTRLLFHANLQIQLLLLQLISRKYQLFH